MPVGSRCIARRGALHGGAGASRSGPRRGQALLIAVIIMLLIMLVLALLTAIAMANQTRTTQHLGRVDARALGEAAVRYADRMLQHHPLGADWRANRAPTFDNSGAIITPPWPPVVYADAVAAPPWPGPTAANTSPGFWGPDTVPDTEDDYYTEFEIRRELYGVMAGTAAQPGSMVRLGYRVYPDPTVENELEDPVTFGRGRALLRVEYQPRPADQMRNIDDGTPSPLGRAIRIDAVGVVDDEGTQWAQVTAYKPIGITDYGRFITDKGRSGRPATLGGRGWYDFNEDGIVDPGEDIPTVYMGGVKCNTKLRLRGYNTFYLLGHDPRLQSLYYVGPGAGSAGRPRFLRNDTIEAVRGIDIVDGSSSVAAYEWDDAVPQFGYSQHFALRSSGDPAYQAGGASGGDPALHRPVALDGQNALDAGGNSRRCARLEPPRLLEPDPVTGKHRYYTLTAESGTDASGTGYVAQTASTGGGYANVGLHGYGEGIYIDNRTDIQFGHDMEDLMADLQLMIDAEEERAVDSGWNPTGTLYEPVGVEIEICPSDVGYVSAWQEARPTPPGVLWFPAVPYDSTHYHLDDPAGAVDSTNTNQAPILKITRHDKQWAAVVPGPSPVGGVPSGEHTRLFDWPANGVVYAEGNVRVKGTMPSRALAWLYPDGTGRPNADRLTRGDGTFRDFNLTIVSGGSVFVEGSIVPAVAEARFASASDAYNTRYESFLALLARDCVVVNTTQIVPQEHTGSVAAEPDVPPPPSGPRPEPGELHWELDEAGDSVYTQFRYGGWSGVPAAGAWPFARINREPAPPGMDFTVTAPTAFTWATYPSDGLASAVTSVVPMHCGEDPGASGVAMWVNGAQHGMFGSPNSIFYFLPYGSFLPGGPSGPTPYISYALSPVYERLETETEVPPLLPRMPWPVSLGENPLARNTLAFYHAQDSHTPMPYWLKRFKVEEVRNDPVADGFAELMPAVHCQIHALMYAENGAFCVIPGQYFDANPTQPDPARFRRYNYDIEIVGPISENRTAEPSMVDDWCDRWSYPVGPSASPVWGQIVHRFGGTHVMTRDARLPAVGTAFLGGSADGAPEGWRFAVDSTREATCSVYPCLPVSPDLIFVGETN